MALMHMTGARARRCVFAACAAVAAAWQPAFAGPQSQSGGGEGRRTVRARTCVDCDASDSLRWARERLVYRMDSLRWEYEHRRLSETERGLVALEMQRTVNALAEAMRESAALTAGGGAAARAGVRAQAPSVAIAVQTGRRTRGYLGVTFDGPWSEMGHEGERVIRFYQYPRITLVEPSSPADRAGILAGDTLLALNGTDVREHEISFTRLLVPDARVTMRVRREGSPRDIRVTVGETPDYYVRRLTPLPPAVAEVTPSPRGQVRVYGRTPMPAPTPPAAAYSYSTSDGIAGAHVETVSAGLGRALGVKQGVLVIRANPGTPAFRAGLRDGDVVISAAGRSLVRVSDLRNVLARAGESAEAVPLVIVREGKQRELTLRLR